MTLASVGFLFSVVVRLAWAEVQKLRHIKPLTSVPQGFLTDVMEDYTCWGDDIAEVVIHANHARDERRRDIVVATCRAACLSNIGCHAWTLHHGSHGARGSGHCWLKYGCGHKNVDPYSVSGLVDHKNLIQHVQAPDTVDPADLVGVLDDTNCWGRDLKQVAIKSTGDTTRDELAVACKDACVADRECAAWTLNHGPTGAHNKSSCWLKSSCAGRKHDTLAEAGIVTHNPTTKATTDASTSTISTSTSTSTSTTYSTSVTSTTTSTASAISTSGTTNGTTTGAGSDAGSSAKVGHSKINPTTSIASATSTSGTTSSTTTGAGSDAGSSAEVGRSKINPTTSTASATITSGTTSSTTTGPGSDTGSIAEVGHSKIAPGNGTGGNFGKTIKKPSKMRFLEHSNPAAPQPPLSEKEKGIIGSAVGASTGALALGLLAGLLPATSPQSTGGLVQPSPTLAAVGVNGAGAKSHAPAGRNSKINDVSDADVVFFAGVANDTNDTNHEEEEEENPVKQWWGWVFLIPVFLMAALCCFAFFVFKGHVSGMWSTCKRSRACSEEEEEGLETSINTSEDILNGDLVSPRSPVHMFARSQVVYNSLTAAPQAFFRSPVHPPSRNVTVPMAPLQNTQIRHLPQVPMAQAGVRVIVPTSAQWFTSQQQQLSSTTSQQQSQGRGQQSPPSRRAGGSNSLFDALGRTQDGVITRTELNTASGVSPLLVGSDSTPGLRAGSTSEPRVSVGSPSMALARPGVPPTTAEVASPVLHPNLLRASANVTPQVEIRS